MMFGITSPAPSTSSLRAVPTPHLADRVLLQARDTWPTKALEDAHNVSAGAAVMLYALMRGEWAISGFRARDLRRHISRLAPSRSSYLIKRLRTHAIIKKAGHCYKYYLTKFGRNVIATLLKLKQQLIVPDHCQFAT
jgi:hypothetical protein